MVLKEKTGEASRQHDETELDRLNAMGMESMKRLQTIESAVSGLRGLMQEIGRGVNWPAWGLVAQTGPGQGGGGTLVTNDRHVLVTTLHNISAGNNTIVLCDSNNSQLIKFSATLTAGQLIPGFEMYFQNGVWVYSATYPFYIGGREIPKR